MWSKTFASRLLEKFAEDRRRVISDWRIIISARRIAYADNAPLPGESKAREILKYLLRRDAVAPIDGTSGVYIIDVPYANLLDVSEEQIIQEANPWAVFGFLTAMVHHGLTDLVAKEVHAIDFKVGEHLKRIPLGTTQDDWVDLEFPPARHPKQLDNTRVVWSRIQGKWDFGVTIGYSSGMPVYVTDRERTLLDALRMPESCGGIAKVLEAWRRAEDCDLDRLVRHTEKFRIQNLKQRVGFILEKLGRPHARLAKWRDRLQRGGSVKLLASGPYSETYSTEWNLSLNVSPSVLAILEED
jgi:predicted transcriptional regulator of viral defense system